MAVKVKSRSGETIVLLNPAEKARKYAVELKNDCRITNTGKRKKNPKTGNPVSFSDTQKAFRAGYLSARKDNAKAYLANKKKKKTKNF